MNIIPVIDLLDGEVVHARRGQRHYYRPIQTPLCAGSKPMDVIAAMVSLAPFRTLYIADLNALMHQGNNVSIIQRIQSCFPAVEFWLDAGFPVSAAQVTPVIGSESLTEQTLPQLKRFAQPFILSLDFSAEQQFMGPKQLLESADYWPQTVIIMSLSQVGAGAGPDCERLARFSQQYGDRRWVAAGGVRDDDDVLALQRLGASAVLVASALHTGGLSLDRFVS